MELEQLRLQLAKQESKRRNRRRNNSSEEEENDLYDSQQLNKLFFQPIARRPSKDWQQPHIVQSFYAGNWPKPTDGCSDDENDAPDELREPGNWFKGGPSICC